jgi:hypothetical protein
MQRERRRRRASPRRLQQRRARYWHSVTQAVLAMMSAHDAAVKQSMQAWSATLNGSLLRLELQLEKLCGTDCQLALAPGAPAGALAQLS